MFCHDSYIFSFCFYFCVLYIMEIVVIPLLRYRLQFSLFQLHSPLASAVVDLPLILSHYIQSLPISTSAVHCWLSCHNPFSYVFLVIYLMLLRGSLVCSHEHFFLLKYFFSSCSSCPSAFWAQCSYNHNTFLQSSVSNPTKKMK